MHRRFGSVSSSGLVAGGFPARSGDIAARSLSARSGFVALVPHGHWKTLTFLAGLRHDRIVAPFVIGCANNDGTFTAGLVRCLGPTLTPGPVLTPGNVGIAYNLGGQKSYAARQFIRYSGAHLLLLPPYSPRLEPGRAAFPKLKSHLRKAGLRSFTDLLHTLAEICDLFPPQHCCNCFNAARYVTV